MNDELEYLDFEPPGLCRVILKELNTNKGSYAKKITDKINKIYYKECNIKFNQSSIYEIIIELEKLNLVIKTKDSKHEYYKPTEKGAKYLKKLEQVWEIEKGLQK